MEDGSNRLSKHCVLILVAIHQSREGGGGEDLPVPTHHEAWERSALQSMGRRRRQLARSLSTNGAPTNAATHSAMTSRHLIQPARRSQASQGSVQVVTGRSLRCRRP